MAHRAALAVADSEPATGPVELAPEEAALLLRICRRYRSSLPTYLRCVQEEARRVDEIMRKISASAR